MFNPLRLGFVVVASVVIASALGCGEGDGAASGPAKFKVDISSMFITVENQSGSTLVDVRIAIVPYSPTLYTTNITRMEAGERRDVSLGNFYGKDGTPFNLRIARPKLVRVSGTDMQGKVHEGQFPWK